MFKVKSFAFIIGILALCGSIVLWFVFFVSLDSDGTETESYRVGKPLPLLQGGILGSLEQKDISTISAPFFLINVWGSWCVTCAQEHTFLNQLKKQDIPVIGINYRDTPEAATLFLEKHGNPYEFSFFDPNGRLAIEMGITAAPETFLIDSKRHIRLHKVGMIDIQVWNETFKPVIQQIMGSEI